MIRSIRNLNGLFNIINKIIIYVWQVCSGIQPTGLVQAKDCKAALITHH